MLEMWTCIAQKQVTKCSSLCHLDFDHRTETCSDAVKESNKFTVYFLLLRTNGADMARKEKTNEYLRKHTEQVGRARWQGQVRSIASSKYCLKVSGSCRDLRWYRCVNSESFTKGDEVGSRSGKNGYTFI